MANTCYLSVTDCMYSLCAGDIGAFILVYSDSFIFCLLEHRYSGLKGLLPGCGS